MKCPFLEEVLVRYCKAYPIKKMLPRESLAQEDPCVGCPEKCQIYQEVAKFFRELEKEGSEIKEVVVKKEEEVKECIWMKAGVVAYRLCTKNYDCKNCEFDQALMDRSGTYPEQPSIAQAIEKLKSMPGDKRKCRYMLTGDLSYKLCSNNYECWHCPVDQMISDLTDFHPVLVRKRAKKEVPIKKVAGFTLRSDTYYHPNHIWVRIEKDGTIKIGIDDFAARLLGEMSEVSLPKGEVRRKEAGCEFRIKRRYAQIPLPITGDVLEHNPEVLRDPRVIYQDPQERGWLMSIQMEEIADNLKDFRKGSRAEGWLREEFDRLARTLKAECEITIADGGELVPNFPFQISDQVWQRLIEIFLQR